ncbi:Oligopeptide transporter [Quillaja saponaria]|uniref:Oligopeptide transporter n=1 Tax=Quillaja saponaria TaxID=32244 RepID=A0AAD7KPA3_QUISA|nr:Oligopeptide transporter [Quillaja saponaria]
MGTESSSVEISEPLLLDSQKIRSGESEPVPEWKDQITIRGLVVSAVLGTLFCIITHKLNLTVGIIPSLNVSAGLLGFFFVKTWTGFLSKLGLISKPFTRQENTVIQTCVVACYGLAFSGGFGLGLDDWFHVCCQFPWAFSLVPLRKVMVMDYKLTYPSGTATAMLINSFHTKTGAELAEKQVSHLGKYLSISLCWSCFKWFFSGIGDSCGFDNFPSFGLTLFKNTFYFDFSPTYVGCGLICPHIVNCSVLFGAILSWGFLWPLISKHAGDWYPADLGSNDFKGLYGYKVFISISLILGDGLYNLIKIIMFTVKEMLAQRSKQTNLPVMIEVLDGESSKLVTEQRRRDEIFFKGQDTLLVCSFRVMWVLAAISTATIPLIFPPLKWYLVLCTYILAPALAFCNSYGTGLTDWNLTFHYGKIGSFHHGQHW